ncbi:hypothetical protein K3495_g5765 [Podosphaera aphanis]|nr:hypothetical protein K3495_g5765 [Podosphaera aphanis]
MVVKKPLYGIAEAGTHWWATYNTHHKEKLQMTNSTYDSCLLISTRKIGSCGIVAKEKPKLSDRNPISFNGCILQLTDHTIRLTQKEQALKIVPVDTKVPEFTKKYVEQRARVVYIASICQPEATFELSRAAQTHNPSTDEIDALNKRLKWQKENIKRAIDYVPIKLETAKLFVFVDSSFANNKDLSSQMGFLIILGNEDTSKDNSFSEFAAI